MWPADRGAYLAASGGARTRRGDRPTAREELGSAPRRGLSRGFDRRDRGCLPACLALAKARADSRAAYSNEYRKLIAGRGMAGLADSGARHSSLALPWRSVGAGPKSARYP